MTEDITKRLKMFTGGMDVKRIALNMDQIEAFLPPPNPTKITDSQAKAYISIHGHESWELDALDPATLEGLIRNEIEGIIDRQAWTKSLAKERNDVDFLKEARKRALND